MPFVNQEQFDLLDQDLPAKVESLVQLLSAEQSKRAKLEKKVASLTNRITELDGLLANLGQPQVEVTEDSSEGEG